MLKAACLAVLLAACAHSGPDTRTGSADEALAQRPPPPPDPACDQQSSAAADYLASDHDNPRKVEEARAVVAAVETVATLDEQRKCHATAAHDAKADAIQAQRSQALTPTAETLFTRAQTAARAGDCATVVSLEGSVDDDNADYHDRVFVRDPDIARCLKK